ncbi:cytochrome P450 [Poronia punctata]|nr:cytochrome P450 [Poronia punctata]
MSYSSWTSGTTTLVCLGVLGLLSHRLYFIHGEHHLKGPQYVTAWGLFVAIAVYYLVSVGHDILWPIFAANVAFFCPLYASIVVYRVFEHPLRHFDGPPLAAASKLWHFAHMFTTPNHLFLDNIVRKYGDFVRTGPQELTVVHPGIWDALSSRDNTCIKAPWYDMLYPYVSLNSIRGKEGYRTRRRLWDEALRISKSYLPEEDSCIERFATLLHQQVEASSGRVLNMKSLFTDFSFDVMGDIAFGRSFSLLKGSNDATPEESHDAPELISQGMSMLRFFTPIPWIARICFGLAPYVPVITQKWNRALGWAAEVCDDRIKRDVGNGTDAFSRFIAAASVDGTGKSFDRLALYGDAFAITVAGSHSTAATLTMMFFELARHPDVQDQVRTEVLSASYDGEAKGGVDRVAVRYPLLDACITETLRLYPVVPTGGIRQTVNTGMHIGDKYIPPHTIIVAPRWTLGRLESAFERPNEFIPERWTSKPQLVKDARPYNGFGIGQHSCPGKKLGLAEVRCVAARLLASFEFAHAESDPTKTRTIDDLQDSFTAAPGDLELVFKPLVNQP